MISETFWWKLENNYVDSVASQNLSAAGSGNSFVAGKVGIYALSLDGNGYAKGTCSWNGNHIDRSFTCWFKMTSDDYLRIFTAGENPTNGIPNGCVFGVRISPHKLFFNGNYNDVEINLETSKEDWHFLALTYTASTKNIKVYIDKDLKINSILINNNIGLNKMAIGANNYAGYIYEQLWIGLIDDVRYFENHVLTIEEIINIFSIKYYEFTENIKTNDTANKSVLISKSENIKTNDNVNKSVLINKSENIDLIEIYLKNLIFIEGIFINEDLKNTYYLGAYDLFIYTDLFDYPNSIYDESIYDGFQVDWIIPGIKINDTINNSFNIKKSENAIMNEILLKPINFVRTENIKTNESIKKEINKLCEELSKINDLTKKQHTKSFTYEININDIKEIEIILVEPINLIEQYNYPLWRRPIIFNPIFDPQNINIINYNPSITTMPELLIISANNYNMELKAINETFKPKIIDGTK
jgi:hypothetical protein